VKGERWQQVERLYHSTLAKQPQERSAFLAEACAGDEALRREVESLLAYEERAENFIESPALEVAAKMMAGEHSRTVGIGESFNQYRIVSRIGAGGMGEVYLADDTRLRRRVALKFLPDALTKDKRHLRRFEVEAHAIAAMSHPNACTIHEVIQTGDGRHCIVMEYVEGMTLRERMINGLIKADDALDIASQIASALSSAHAAGIVHRDIKPENVMLRRDGYVKVLDFGLAKLAATRSDPANSQAETRASELKTTPGVLMGTVAYMSPEQARGLPVDARTDVWSLGVVLYEMVAEQKPFAGATPTDVIISIVEREPEPLSKSAPEAIPLQRIVMKALAKDQNERYQTPEEMLGDLKSVKRELELGAGFEGYRATGSMPDPSGSGFRLSNRVMTRNRLIVLTAIATVVVIALLAGAWFSRSSITPPPAAKATKSLAVLPMVNLSGDESQDYFAEGMTETLIAGLAKVGALRVISRTSVMQFKGSQKPLKVIARELNVDAIVEGSLQRFGDQLRVDVRLIDAATEQHIWTEHYVRDLRDVLTIQNEVTRAVTQAIQIKLTPQEQVRLTKAHRVDPAAYDEFLRGRYYLNRQTKADNGTAIQSLSRAVVLDPDFAGGWAELAQAYVWRLFLFAPDEKDLQEKAFVAVEKALTLDPELPEAYLARGRLLWTPGNHFPHDKAIQEYRRALALNPSLDEAHNQLALVLGHVGLLDEALAELDKALATNPSNNLARFRVGEILLFQGKHEEALTALRNVPTEVNPALVGHQIVFALFNLGRKEEASATLEKFLRDYPEDNRGLFTSLQAIFAASAGQERVAEQKIALAIERGKGFGHFHHTAYHIACAYAIMNRREQAIKWLESAANDGFPCYTLFEADHNLNNLRQDAHFQTLMAKLKQQWEFYKAVPGVVVLSVIQQKVQGRKTKGQRFSHMLQKLRIPSSA
jgi:serine/threonine protein kinase/TolB-like protein/Tfp pilus assembly protein PilF